MSEREQAKVKRVAQAICRAVFRDVHGESEELELWVENRWERFAAEAKAAIEAIEEPVATDYGMSDMGKRFPEITHERE